MWASLWELLSNMLFMALHVVNAGSFPRPLTAKQEQEYLAAYRETGDLSARSALVEHNLRLVAHIIKKYYRTVKDQEDLISVGTIGLLKAVDTFDGSKGTRLATYASRCIENEILMQFRSNRKTSQDVSISDPIDTDKDGHPLTLMDVIADSGDLVEDVSRKLNSEKLPRYMAEVLTEREQDILRWRYLEGEGLTQREVAQKYGISRSYISRIEKRALEKLYTRFERGDPKQETPRG